MLYRLSITIASLVTILVNLTIMAALLFNSRSYNSIIEK